MNPPIFLIFQMLGNKGRQIICCAFLCINVRARLENSEAANAIKKTMRRREGSTLWFYVFNRLKVRHYTNLKQTSKIVFFFLHNQVLRLLKQKWHINSNILKPFKYPHNTLIVHPKYLKNTIALNFAEPFFFKIAKKLNLQHNAIC